MYGRTAKNDISVFSKNLKNIWDLRELEMSKRTRKTKQKVVIEKKHHTHIITILHPALDDIREISTLIEINGKGLFKFLYDIKKFYWRFIIEDGISKMEICVNFEYANPVRGILNKLKGISCHSRSSVIALANGGLGTFIKEILPAWKKAGSASSELNGNLAIQNTGQINPFILNSYNAFVGNSEQTLINVNNNNNVAVVEISSCILRDSIPQDVFMFDTLGNRNVNEPSALEIATNEEDNESIEDVDSEFIEDDPDIELSTDEEECSIEEEEDDEDSSIENDDEDLDLSDTDTDKTKASRIRIATEMKLKIDSKPEHRICFIQTKVRRLRMFDDFTMYMFFMRNRDPTAGDFDNIFMEINEQNFREVQDVQPFVKEYFNGTHRNIPNGIIDVLSKDVICEVKRWSNYRDALGQIDSYGGTWIHHRKHIHFFGKAPDPEFIMQIFLELKIRGITMSYEGFEWKYEEHRF